MTDPTVKPATQNQIRAEQLVAKLFQSADFGPKIRKVAKEIFPDISVPEDVVDPVIAPLREENEALRKHLEALSQKFEAREKKESETQAFHELEKAINAAGAKFKLTAEGIAAMIGRMQETKNFTDVEAAAAWVAHSAPPQQTAGPTWAANTARANLFGSAERDERYARLHTNPEGFLDDEILAFARDPDAYTRAA